MNISGLDKAKILAALYNGSQQQGLGFLNDSGRSPMTPEEALKEFDNNLGFRFDYLRGRVMKVDLAGDDLDTWLYNRDNGEGAAESIINAINFEAE